MLKKYVSLLIISLSLSACSAVNTNINYEDENLTQGSATSAPIYLTLKDTSKSKMFFILSNKLSDNNFTLQVHWINKARKKQYNGKETTIRFLVNNMELFNLNPYQQPKIVAYHIDPPAIEEVAVFNLTREQLILLTKADNVNVALEGKYRTQLGSFNKLNSFRAFKNFLNNT